MNYERVRCHVFELILSGILLGGLTAQAQTSSPSPSPSPQTSTSDHLEHDFFKNLLKDQKAIWTSPFHLRGHDAVWLGPLGYATTVMIATDRDSADEIGESRGGLNTSRDISYIGSAYGIATVAGTFYLAGRATHNERARETGILGAEAFIDSGIVVAALKGITQRPRPTAGEDRGKFFHEGNSFPSGHSIESWSLATVVANEYHDNRLIQITAYGLASAVSISRFTGHNHFLSDVLVGSAMGYGIGRYVYKTHHIKPSDSGGTEEEESLQPSRHWPSIAPEYSRAARVYGVALGWSF